MAERIIAIPRRLGAWLALLALALQLGLSIGHVHKVDLDWGHAAELSVAKPSIAPGDDRSPAAPSGDQCPICFGLAASGTFVLSASLCVILAIVFEKAGLDPAPQLTLLWHRYF